MEAATSLPAMVGRAATDMLQETASAIKKLGAYPVDAMTERKTYPVSDAYPIAESVECVTIEEKPAPMTEPQDSAAEPQDGPLHSAARKGDYDAIESALARGALGE